MNSIAALPLMTSNVVISPMNKPFVYLAGPIYGCTEDGAKGWRQRVADELATHNITAISPLRSEPAGVGGVYELQYQCRAFGHPRAILAKNFFDLRRADFVLVYFPPGRADGQQLSIGTIGELSWAYALRKPCVVVTTDPLAERHPFTSRQADWPVLPSLADAVRLIVGTLAGYAGGANV